MASTVASCRAQKHFPLLKLAGEIRNRIYKYALAPNPTGTLIALVPPVEAEIFNPQEATASHPDTLAPALLLVNRQINTEATFFLYASLCFADTDSLYHFLAARQPQTKTMIKSVTLLSCRYPQEWTCDPREVDLADTNEPHLRGTAPFVELIAATNLQKLRLECCLGVGSEYAAGHFHLLARPWLLAVDERVGRTGACLELLELDCESACCVADEPADRTTWRKRTDPALDREWLHHTNIARAVGCPMELWDDFVDVLDVVSGAMTGIDEAYGEALLFEAEHFGLVKALLDEAETGVAHGAAAKTRNHIQFRLDNGDLVASDGCGLAAFRDMVLKLLADPRVRAERIGSHRLGCPYASDEMEIEISDLLVEG